MKGWRKKDVPLVEENEAREYLSKIDFCKPTAPDGMHTLMLRELADVIVRPLHNLLLRFLAELREVTPAGQKR